MSSPADNLLLASLTSDQARITKAYQTAIAAAKAIRPEALTEGQTFDMDTAAWEAVSSAERLAAALTAAALDSASLTRAEREQEVADHAHYVTP